MNANMSIYQFHRPTGTHIEPPKSSKPIITSSFEISPEYIEFLQKQPFSREGEENPYIDLRSFIKSMTSFALKACLMRPLNGSSFRSL